MGTGDLDNVRGRTLKLRRWKITDVSQSADEACLLDVLSRSIEYDDLGYSLAAEENSARGLRRRVERLSAR